MQKDYRGLFWAVVLLLMIPLTLVDFLPLVDVPGHLARIHIIRNYDNVPHFQHFYELSPKLIPHVTMDGILLLLEQVMLPYQAMRVFVAISMVVFALGCWTLSYSVHGRITPIAILALFLQYNSTFFYGFVAFQFGVGLALITVGVWYRWRGAWSAARVGALIALAVLTYLTHLGGYLYLGVALGWLTLRIWHRERRISATSLLGLLPLIPPLLIYLSLGKNRGQVNQILFAAMSEKVRHGATLLVGYDYHLDGMVGLVLLAAAVAAWWYGKYRWNADLGSLGLVFSFLFLVMPWWLLTGSDADTRMVLGAGVFLFLAVTFELPPATGKVIFAVALMAFLVRVVFCSWIWVRQSEFMAGHAAFLNRIPEGARVYPLVSLPEDWKARKFERVMIHVPDLATIQRQAIVPTTFTVTGQHTVVDKIPRWYQNNINPTQPEAFNWALVAKEYDVIWQYGSDTALRTVLQDRFTLLGQYGEARLYQTRK